MLLVPSFIVYSCLTCASQLHSSLGSFIHNSIGNANGLVSYIVGMVVFLEDVIAIAFDVRYGVCLC